MKVRELTAQLMALGSPAVSQQPPNIGYDGSSAPVPQLRTAVAPNEDPRNPSSRQSLSGNQSDEPADAADAEIMDVNRHTNAVEFHGSTSSLAILGYLQRRQSQKPGESGGEETASLVSALHNPAFSPQSGHNIGEKSQNIYLKQAHKFIEGYFENLHFIHPLIDKEDFIARANDLWFGLSRTDDSSFIVLYLSLMSLGALVRSWDEDQLDGLTRFEWSRKLFTEAQAHLNERRFSNDLDTVQAMYLMVSPGCIPDGTKLTLVKAKVCQNELNPHLAYMYLGFAVRTCLSAGFNRESPNPKFQHSSTISKTWWGIYSLEIEMSFSVGRPDTLGMDEYHNRKPPLIDESESAMIPIMVNLARIIRKVSVSIYHLKSPWQEKLKIASKVERELDVWRDGLPDRVKPMGADERLLGALKEPKWCRRQRLVLNIRKFKGPVEKEMEINRRLE
jgi:Fungal specific transcription factor domain